MDKSTIKNKMVVVFGRPGAGKTTISNKALEKIQHKNHDFLPQNKTTYMIDDKPQCLVLDLDVCVPLWMRQNFAKGIYPTLAQRNEFAVSACDYVENEIKNFSLNNSNGDTFDGTKITSVIISFSFVNNDLREYFISRFPHAQWALVDVTDPVAQDRINSREGHFYKGAPPSSSATDDEAMKEKSKINDEDSSDNDEWNFAPVNYDHVILDGLDAVEKNAEIVLGLLF